MPSGPSMMADGPSMVDTTCPVCLELLSQPVSAPCGHIFCFMCIHRAMDPCSASVCPLCRHPFSHLPQECKQLSAALRCLAADRQDQQPLAADFECPLCGQLLWQPAVLTCGHAVCGACLPALLDSSPCCAVCQLPIRSIPSTCRPLQVALQTLFPEQMEQRAQQASGCRPLVERLAASQADAAVRDEGGSGAVDVNVDADTSSAATAHYGVGCDSCGAFPVHGRCWTCDVCTELRPDMGFDLCDECYTAGRHMFGRFAQQHTADHKMRERPLRKTFMHMMRSRHPSLSAQELLGLIRHAILPDEEDDTSADLAEDVALHLALGNAPAYRGPDPPSQ